MEKIREEIKNKKAFPSIQHCARHLKADFSDGTFSSEKIQTLQTQEVPDVRDLKIGDWIIIKGPNGQSQFISITKLEKTTRNADEALKHRAETWSRVAALTYQSTPHNTADAQEEKNNFIITYTTHSPIGSSNPIETSSEKFFAIGKILKII